MSKLTDYLEIETLKHLAGIFSTAVGGSVSILDVDGAVLAGKKVAPKAASAKVTVGGKPVGSVALSTKGDDARGVRMLGLIRDVLMRLCEQAATLRDRVEELAAVYRLTDVFNGRLDLREVHKLVAETMVKATNTDACSIRILDEAATELTHIAAYGLSRAYMTKGRILLKDSQIDQAVVATGKDVYIADERTDERVLYQAQARKEGIVSALCVPMAYRGKIVGIIRVYTRSRHEFDWYESSMIHAVAAQAAAAIVNARLYNEALEAENIRRQLRLAGEVQRRMIPVLAPHAPGYDIATIYVPCFELGGDFYDFIELAGGNLGICVADVVGKGVRASLLMASARSALRAYAAHIYEISDVMSAVNVHMHDESQESDFVTMFYGVLDGPNRRLTYCNAGHEPGLLIRQGQVRQLVSQGGIIGMDETMRFGKDVIDLIPGDVIVLYTDGLAEAFNFHDEPFGRGRVRDAALDACRRGESAEGVGKHLLWEMRRFIGLQARCDDLTLVMIKVQ